MQTPNPSLPARIVLGAPHAGHAAVAALDRSGVPITVTVETMDEAVAVIDESLAARSWPPLVALLHEELPGVNGELVRGLLARGIPTIMLVAQRERRYEETLTRGRRYSDDVLSRMERLGAVHVASWPPVPHELFVVTTEVLQTLGEHEQIAAESVDGPFARGTIAFSGGVGGSGKSTLACNMAVLLASRYGRRVLLLDLDPIAPSVHWKLGLDPSPGVGLAALYRVIAPLNRPHGGGMAGAEEWATQTQSAESGERWSIDEQIARVDLSSYPLRYTGPLPSGGLLDVLTGVTHPREAATIAGDLMPLHSYIRLARERYDDVILDLGTETTTNWHEECAARADRLVVVAWPQPDGIERAARAHHALLESTTLSADRCSLVLNHAPERLSAMMSLEAIALRMRAAGVTSCAAIVPHDGTCVGEARLAHPGRPLIPVADTMARTSLFVQAIEEMVTVLRPGIAPDGRRRVRPLAAFWQRILRRPTWSAAPPEHIVRQHIAGAVAPTGVAPSVGQETAAWPDERLGEEGQRGTLRERILAAHGESETGREVKQ